MSDYTRTIAKRMFAVEISQIKETHKVGEDQFAPNFSEIPSGGKVNRVFFCGVLTEREDIGTESSYMRGRITDPTGGLLVYAGQYQPEAAQLLEEIETPAYVAVVGKLALYEPDDGKILVSVRPESITAINGDTVEKWTAECKEQTLARLDALEDMTDAQKKLREVVEKVE